MSQLYHSVSNKKGYVIAYYTYGLPVKKPWIFQKSYLIVHFNNVVIICIN